MQAFEIDRRDAVGLEPAVEVIEAPEGFVGLGENVPPPAVVGIERELALGVDAAAEVAVGRTVESALVPHAGEIDAVTAARQTLPPIADQQRARVLGVHRREGEVVVVGEREVVGDLDRGAELVGMSVARHEEAGLALHGRVSHLKPGHVDDRHAQQVEDGVLVGEGGLIALMGDLAGAYPPGGRPARIFLADLTRREPSLFEHRDVAGLARRRGGDDARVVLGDELQRFDEAVAEIVGEGHLIGGDDRAVGVLDADIALGGERVRAAIVDHLIGEQRVVAVVELDIALGGDLGVIVVVDHLVGLQQHGLRLVDLSGAG